MISQNLKEKICKIKKLKSDNFLTKYFVFKTFYNNYKTQRKIFSSPGIEQNINEKVFLSRLRNKNMNLFIDKSKSTNHLLSLESDYLNYTPYVTKMMKTGIESTKYDSTKYTSTKKEEIKNLKKNSKKKKYFGLPGDTPLIKTGTFSDLYSTQSPKTFSKINSLSEQNIFKNEKKLNFDKILDNDRKEAGELFMDSSRHKNFKTTSKKVKNNFYEKYNIINQLTIAEEIKINKIMNKNKKDILYLNPVFKSINTDDSLDLRAHIYTSERQYKDPYQSFKKMKIKNQMMKLIDNLNINFQCKKFQKEYNNICGLNIQKNQMRNLKIIPKKKLKIFKGFNAEQYLKNLNSNELSFEDDSKQNSRKKNKKAQIFFFHKPQTIYARGEDLEEVELKVEHFPCLYHPEIRTKTAICFNEEKGQIFLFGGLEGKKLSDLWQFNFEQIKMGWKKIYEPEEYTDYVSEPLPRFGHTLHFYNDKLYLIGGEFIDWNKNDLKEGIMCIYDIKNNIWDMMKYIYDLKWYNKKKEERKETMRNQILTFNEISKTLSSMKENNETKTNNKTLKERSINSPNKKSGSKLLINQLEKKKFSLLAKNINYMNSRNSKMIKVQDKLKLSKKTYNNIKESDESYIYPQLRRYHISLLIGTNIFLYGGETPSKKCLNDCWIYDLINQKWSLLEYIGRFPPPLCCHSACLILEQNQLINEALNVYYKPQSEQKTLHLLKSDGVFFFGGYNENKIPTNLFFKMEIGVKPVVFEIPKTKGKPPSPRIQATMNFNSENNLIVIHGGRNDLKNEVYNDIVLLDMENMCWIQTKFWGEKPLHRSEHSAVVISNKLFIFGGINNNKYINFDFTIFNLDFFAQKYAIKNDA